MNEQKQIEEMAEVLKDYTAKKHIMASHVILECYAEELYKAGFKRQSENTIEFPCKWVIGYGVSLIIQSQKNFKLQYLLCRRTTIHLLSRQTREYISIIAIKTQLANMYFSPKRKRKKLLRKWKAVRNE